LRAAGVEQGLSEAEVASAKSRTWEIKMERFDPRRLSRRSLLGAMAALAGTAALPRGIGLAHAANFNLPTDCGRGRSVAIIGAGMAGLTAGWKLANSGFRVTIYEADSRYGGRSLTVRPDDDNGQNGAYRQWWLTKYNPENLFPAMYVSRYEEDRGPNREVQQICRFADDTWEWQNWRRAGKPPVELFLNAGPGRIPSDHEALLTLCGEIGVALEPYIFQSNYNLLRNMKFDGGKPIAYNQVNYSLRGQLAEKMAKYANASCNSDNDLTGRMLKEFGDLDKECGFPSLGGSARSARVGYRDLPGGWNTPGKTKEIVPWDKVLESGFVGGGNPELEPGSFLFNADNILWQNSLMQPIGGMDRIWQRLLVQTIPREAIEMNADDPREREFEGRSERYVGDLVRLNQPVKRLVSSRDRVTIIPVNGQAWNADFCISTMAPKLLQEALPNDEYHARLRAALGRADPMVPAIKVGWQARTRFWEKENHIYGGISWTDDDIGQIWYPSEDFNMPTGVLTGAYNRGPTAAKFGDKGQDERIDAALIGGETLHPGFKGKVYSDKGVTIAWQYMPFQLGGWAPLIATRQPEIYQTMIMPLGRLYVAGDSYSYLPGWLEGAVTSAYKAVDAIGCA
jgi:monoamine oxidase